VHYCAVIILGSPRFDGQVDSSLLAGSDCERTATLDLSLELQTVRSPGLCLQKDARVWFRGESEK